jgi:FKBP-type peptidyl-prolyl cis-trans isomerase
MSKELLISVIISLILVGGLIYFIRYTSMNSNQALNTEASQPGSEQPSSGLVVEDVNIGNGDAAKAGDTLTVNYVGTLSDGTQFDSSYDRGTPFSFKLGVGQVIRGWDEGMVGMRIGGKRNLTIPPELGYGSRGVGLIPPGSTLKFTVELVNIEYPQK